MINGEGMRADGEVDKEISDAAWYYPETKGAAENIRGYVAFCEYSEVFGVLEYL